jgi:hypothetical protein
MNLAHKPTPSYPTNGLPNLYSHASVLCAKNSVKPQESRTPKSNAMPKLCIAGTALKERLPKEIRVIKAAIDIESKTLLSDGYWSKKIP